jgi:hypothetical protein
MLFLLFFVVGMFLAIIIKPRNEYHGPNALNETKKTYYDSKRNKCIKFDIVQVTCPKTKKKYQKIVDLLKK